ALFPGFPVAFWESAGSTSPLLFATNTLSGRSSVDGVPSFPLPEGRQSRRLHNKSTACRRSSWPPVLRLPGRASASTQTYCLPLDVTWTLSSTPLPGLCWRSSQAPSPAGGAPASVTALPTASAPDPPPRHRLPIPSSGQGCLQIPALLLLLWDFAPASGGALASNHRLATTQLDHIRSNRRFYHQRCQRFSPYFGTLLPPWEERWLPRNDSLRQNLT
ncbi:hypothetical protein HDK64DRAFT_304120, partial [Phyllosticta capitalensis]